MSDATGRGRAWAIAAVMLYAAIALTVPGSFGGTLALVPLAMILTAVAWRRDRPSRVRTVATWTTLVALALSLVALVYHLIWGDLS